MNINASMREIIALKDRSKILEDDFNPELLTYTCKFSKSVKYLDSSLLDFLPAGIINKGKTGIGATTFELTSKRDSIIVEPLKVTASSKSGVNHLYIGSETKKHPTKATDEEILEYLQNEDIEFKKIICVSDSLKRIEKLFKQELFHNFFLMIDESDSMQLESNYRNSMEEVYSIFKRHPKEKRCLISATPIHFHDPELRNDFRINFTFEVEEKRKIKILESSNHIGTAADLILSLYKNSTNEKIVLAFNNVKTLTEISLFLVKSGVVKDDISILCGANSKEKATSFYKELVEEKLPTRIVLKTSAYYTGFDLKEKYHLIMAVDTGDFLNVLSDKRITQIAGRARKGLLSETIILNYKEKVKKVKNEYSFPELEKMASIQLQVYKCIESNFRENKILRDRTKEGYKAMLEKTRIEGFHLISLLYDTPRISYLSIDAIIDIIKAKTEIYNSKDGLLLALQKSGHEVNLREHHSKTKVSKIEKDDFDHERKAIVNEILSGNLDDFSIKEHYSNHKDSKVKNVARVYLDLSRYFKADEFQKAVLAVWGNSKSLNVFVEAAKFVILPESTPEKVLIKSYFPIGSTFTREEIVNRMKAIQESKSSGGLMLAENEEKVLMSEFRIKISCKPHRNGKLKGINERYTIKGYNTIGIEPIRFKPEIRTSIG